jgi:4'-phosphopantetheinyl transferase
VPIPTWFPGPRPCRLGSEQVHVWAFDLERPDGEVERLARVLSPDESERAGRYLIPAGRRQFVVARALLRRILGAYLDAPPHRLAFTTGPQGKPTLKEHPGLYFNLSHSHGLALVAVTRHAEVGVDVEAVRPHPTHRELADRFFAPSEAAILRGLPIEHSLHAFFHGWTRKEAVLKATGMGLSYGSERVEVTLLPHQPARLLSLDGQSAPAASWSLETFTPAPGYVAALALEGRGYQLHCWSWGE